MADFLIVVEKWADGKNPTEYVVSGQYDDGLDHPRPQRDGTPYDRLDEAAHIMATLSEEVLRRKFGFSEEQVKAWQDDILARYEDYYED